MEKKECCAIYTTEKVKGPFGLRGASISKSHYSSVSSFVLQNTEGILRTMLKLMKRQS